MCVLRADGDSFEPREFLLLSTLDPCNVFRKGERKSETTTWHSSGLTVPVSECEFDDFEGQIRDAISFLTVHKDELWRLRSFPGVDEVELDFPVHRRDVFVQSQSFPSELVALAGELGLGLELSIYVSNG
jgi:hypothetical protein